MSVNTLAYNTLNNFTNPKGEKVKLVAVSKLKPAESILQLYHLGHRDFGENYVQELVAKQEQLPKDINWHFLGHLQSNKVKYIAPFVHLIQGVDSLKLLQEINKEAKKNNRIINCLLQIFIAEEESKFGFDIAEIEDMFQNNLLANLTNINIVGVMGMASFTTNVHQIKREFQSLQETFLKLKQHNNNSNIQACIASYGMSGDYEIAIANNTNMIRVGSLLFGERK